jgi:hypothetical protein
VLEKEAIFVDFARDLIEILGLNIFSFKSNPQQH